VERDALIFRFDFSLIVSLLFLPGYSFLQQIKKLPKTKKILKYFLRPENLCFRGFAMSKFF